MTLNKKYIWIFGENLGATADNNSFYFWQYVVNIVDDIEKYIVLEKNQDTLKVYKRLSSHEKRFVLWRNSKKHYQKYFHADMFFVTLSYKDILPEKFLFKNTNLIIKKPVIYLQHGTLGLKKIGYTGRSYRNNMFRFFIYNQEMLTVYAEENDFKPYQLYYAKFHPRYGEFLRKDEKIKDKNQILWFLTWREYFGDNFQTRHFIKSIKNILKSPKLINYLSQNNLTLKLCVHQFFNSEMFEDIFKDIGHDLIQVVNPSDTDVMVELVSSKLLITDYSSVAYDFTFLNRPVLLFQPDLVYYMEKREFYADLDDLYEFNIENSDDLIERIVNEDYEINPFFRKAWPENIDYESIKNNKHIENFYKDFSYIQRNKITFLGYNFYKVNEKVDYIMALAESLLEQGYLVELISLKRTKAKQRFPYGLNMNYIYFQNTKSLTEKILRYVHGFRKDYDYFNYDSEKTLLYSSIEPDLKKLMRNIKSNTVVSTRESLHLFLNDCDSPFVNNKIFLFSTASNAFNRDFPNLTDKLNKIDMEKVIFTSDENRIDLEKSLNFNHNSSVVLDGSLCEKNIIDIGRIKQVEEKEVYKGIYILRVSEDRLDEINKLLEFGIYLRDNNIKDLVIEVYGDGEYSNKFMKLLEKNGLLGIIRYRGSTNNPIYEIRQHDFVLDLSLTHASGMLYIGTVLNGKKVFCMENKVSVEMMKNIPNSFIDSFDWLYHQVKHLPDIPLDELLLNYLFFKEKYSREAMSKKFIELLG